MNTKKNNLFLFLKSKSIKSLLIQAFVFAVLANTPFQAFSGTELAYVKSVSGTATLNNKQIKAYDKIQENDILKITPKSKVIIQFSNGITKTLINQTVIFYTKNSKTDQITQKESEKPMEILGVKG